MNKDYMLVKHEKPWRYEENGLTVTRGGVWSGPGCHEGCGVLLYTNKDGDLVKVEGDPDEPYNQGRLCVRCIATLNAVDNPLRIKYPMKRDKSKRGDPDAWERISWDEAYDICETRMNEIKAEFGAEAVMFLQGTGRDIVNYLNRFAWSFGSPNATCPLSGMACYIPKLVSTAASTGDMWIGDFSQQFPDRYENPNYKNPELVILWGNNPIISNSDGVFGHWVTDVMQMGSKLLTVDPRVTWLASKSEHFLQLRPGTDAALAMGLLNVMITEEVYNKDFVEKWCYGFDELAERVSEYTPEKTEEITWVPKEKIIAAARAIAAADGVTLQWGLAVDQTKESLPAAHAMLALVEITGNIDKPGSMITPPTFAWGGWGIEFLSDEQKAKTLGSEKYPLMSQTFGLASPDAMFETLETGKPYSLKAAWIQTNNLLACMSTDPTHTKELLEQLDFIAYVDMFQTPTSQALADVFLPACMFPERDGVMLGSGPQRVKTINKVTSYYETKSDMEILLDMGKRFNPEAWPWDNVQDMFSSMIVASGCDFEEAREIGPAFMPYEYYKYEKGLLRPDGQPGFKTPTGRIELYSNLYSMSGLDPLPYFEEPKPGPTSTPELLDEYPLVLTTGARRWGYFHSEHRSSPHLRALNPDPWVQMHPNTAKEYGVTQGDWVWLENQRGRARRRVELTPILDERVINCDHGWWLPEGDPKSGYSSSELNINNLIPWGECGRSGYGANYKTMLCKVYKVKEGEM